VADDEPVRQALQRVAATAASLKQAWRWLRAPASGWNLIGAALAFVVGIGALLALPTLPPFSLSILLIASVLPRWRGRRYWALAMIGFGWAWFRADAVLAERWALPRTDEVLALRGAVVSLPEDDQAEDDDGTVVHNWRFLFAAENNAAPSRIRVAWYRSSELVRGGDCWTLTLRMRPPHGSRNPGGFDYEGWLFRQRVGATATVRAAEPCRLATGYRVLRWRQRVAEQFATWLPDHPAAPLVAALTIGDTSRITDPDWQAFRLTGTTHLIAISGFNIALIAGAAFFLLRWLWSLSPRLLLRLPAQRAAMVGAGAAALSYALIAGAEPPVLRAAWMCVLALLFSAFGRPLRPGAALASAGGLIVAADPLALLSPGLWLSFSAVAAIFYISAGRLSKPSGWRVALQIQLILSVALAPLTLYWFQGASLIGPLVNLIAVPIVAVLTPLLLIVTMLAAVVPAIGLPLLQWSVSGVDVLLHGLRALAEIAPSTWLSLDPPLAAILVATLGVLCLFAPAGVPLRRFGVLALAALALPARPVPATGFTLAVLDVGQGLAVVVRTAQHTLLFDAGPAIPGGFDSGAAIAVPYLRHIGVRKLDRLMISHADLDHRGGAPALRSALAIDSELGATTAQPCMPGFEWDWDEVHFALLNGPAPGRSDNDGGCVLAISGAGGRALLPADIERDAEAALVETFGDQLHAEVLIAPHHGSRTSSSPDFIAAVAPQIVVHSAGWHHRFRHPSPEVVRRYREAGVAQYNTAEDGLVEIQFSDQGIRVSRRREQARRLWDPAPCSLENDQSCVGFGASP